MNHMINEGPALKRDSLGRNPNDPFATPRQCTGMGMDGEKASRRILSGKPIIWNSHRSTRMTDSLALLGFAAALVAFLLWAWPAFK
jgi:hypothetical protein